MRQKHFAVRTWNGQMWAYFYAGPVRITLFSSSWVKRHGGKLFWAGAFAFLVMAWWFPVASVLKVWNAFLDWAIWVLNRG